MPPLGRVGGLRAVLGPAGVYVGVTARWAVAELLRGTVRRFPGEAPAGLGC